MATVLGPGDEIARFATPMSGELLAAVIGAALAGVQIQVVARKIVLVVPWDADDEGEPL